MKRESAIIACVMVMACASGCSSQPAHFEPVNGALHRGTAQLSINGEDVGISKAVECKTTEELTTITIGEQPSATTVMVSNAGQLKVEWVRIHDLNGFTGSYTHGLNGNARVTMVESTYHISGTAEGSNTANVSALAKEAFEIRVSC